MKKSSAGRIAVTAAFFLGLLLGVAAANLCGDTYLKESGLLSGENILLLKEIAPDPGPFFMWLLARRGKYLVLLWLTGYTVFALPALLLLLLWMGILAGLFLSLAFLHLHLAGLLLFLAAVLPQALLYAPACRIAANAVWEKGILRWKGKKIFQEDREDKNYVQAFLLSLALVLVGLILESTAGPWLLKKAVTYLL